MPYLIAQIFVCLLLATLLGGLVGWLLRGRGDAADGGALVSARQRIEDLEHALANRPEAPREATTSATGASLFGTPAARPTDDLEAISGVGPAIATQLAGIGVTTFRQIAAFTADDVAQVVEALGVSQGRIEREDWIAQAAHLHAHGTRV